MKLVPSFPTASGHGERFITILLTINLNILQDFCHVSSLDSAVPRLNKQSFQHLLLGCSFYASDVSCVSLLDPLQFVYIFLTVRCPKLDTVFQLRPYRCQGEENNYLLCLRLQSHILCCLQLSWVKSLFLFTPSSCLPPPAQLQALPLPSQPT